MKDYLKQTITQVGLISLLIFVFISYNNDYMEYKNRDCLVLDKMTTTGGYKSSANFYLILKEEKGVVFDLIVSPSTFYQCSVGETVVFNLRQMDIKQTPKENLIYFFGPVIFIAIAIVCLIAGKIKFFRN